MMKGRLTDVNESCAVDFDFELSETPKEMVLRLLNSESKDVMQSLFNGTQAYEEAKTQGSFDTAASSIAVKLGYDMVTLDWEETIQAQIGDKLKTFDSKESVPFVATMAKVVG